MKRTLLILPLLLLSLHAKVLTLRDCVDKALASHPDVKSYLLRLKRQHEGLEAQKGAWRPQVSAMAEYDPQRTYVLPLNGRFHTLDEDGWSAALTLRQKIYDFGGTDSKIASAALRRDIAELSYEESKALMRYLVRTAYLGVLVQKAALTVKKKDLEAKEALLEQARALVAQGLKTRADESRFLASVKGAEDTLAQARAAYAKAIATLERYILEPVGEETAFEEGILTRAPDLSAISCRDIVQRNLQLKITHKEDEAAKEEFRSAKAQHFGSLDAIAEATHNETLSNYDTLLLGVRYSVPLYSGGRLRAQTQQARISQLEAAAKSESKRLALTEECRSLRADLDESERRIEARMAQTEAARQTRELIVARYKEGLATYMEVLDAEATWLDARLQLLQAYSTRASKLYRLEYLNAD